MTESLERTIEEANNAMEKGSIFNGYETEGQLQAYIDGIEYATEILKKEYSLNEPKATIRNGIMNPRDYLEAVTGKYYLTREDTCDEVEKILKENGLELWSYTLSDIDEARRDNKELVLVELCNEDNYEEHYCRWFEYQEYEGN